MLDIESVRWVYDQYRVLGCAIFGDITRGAVPGRYRWLVDLFTCSSSTVPMQALDAPGVCNMSQEDIYVARIIATVAFEAANTKFLSSLLIALTIDEPYLWPSELSRAR